MDFLLWAARSLHLFAVVVWLGGLLYQAAVTLPVARVEQRELAESSLHLLRRFQPFVWMCVWTILVTGVALMLFNPRFVLFHYDDRWSVMLGLKQLTFLIMVFYSFGYARMLRMVDLSERAEERQMSYKRMLQFGKFNVALGIIAMLLAAGL